jgi:hypothetical protein
MYMCVCYMYGGVDGDEYQTIYMTIYMTVWHDYFPDSPLYFDRYDGTPKLLSAEAMLLIIIITMLIMTIILSQSWPLSSWQFS